MLAAFECQQRIIILVSGRNVDTLYWVKVDWLVTMSMIEVQCFSQAN